MIKILVVEDDIRLNQIVCSHLIDNSFDATGCLNAKEAYDIMYDRQFDLIVSDIMMPEIDGFEFADSVREIDKTIPILFMTARDDFPSKQKGYGIGIDDYMVKPVDLNELVLHISALLRRANIVNEKMITIGSFKMDTDAMTASVDDEDIPVTVREFNVLYKLLSYPNKTFSRAQLMNEFWGIDSETSFRAIDVHITKLRDKFSKCSSFKIVTVHGLGYKAVMT